MAYDTPKIPLLSSLLKWHADPISGQRVDGVLFCSEWWVNFQCLHVESQLEMDLIWIFPDLIWIYPDLIYIYIYMWINMFMLFFLLGCIGSGSRPSEIPDSDKHVMVMVATAVQVVGEKTQLLWFHVVPHVPCLLSWDGHAHTSLVGPNPTSSSWITTFVVSIRMR